jgi:CO/xanthine dehydrogenase Mo-binding subunit
LKLVHERAQLRVSGKGPLHPVIPAIANAVWDAVGVRPGRIPFTPERVLAAILARDPGARDTP